MKELNNISRLVKTSSTLAVVLMVMATAAMPVVAGDCGTKGQNGVADDFIIENGPSFESLKVFMRLLLDKESLSVIRDLRSKGYELQYGKVDIQRIRSKENMSHEALLVVIHAESKNSTNSAQVVLTFNGEKTCVANAIIEDGANYRRIEVYEIDDGAEKNYVVENRAGTRSIDGKIIPTGLPQIRSVQVSSGQVGSNSCGAELNRACKTCRSVCKYISSAGCALSAYFLCLAACAGVGGPICGPICAVVYAVICTYGTSGNCAFICSAYCY